MNIDELLDEIYEKSLLNAKKLYLKIQDVLFVEYLTRENFRIECEKNSLHIYVFEDTKLIASIYTYIDSSYEVIFGKIANKKPIIFSTQDEVISLIVEKISKERSF
ncbi:hypothetical protein D3C87_76670 [compost metagenome]